MTGTQQALMMGGDGAVVLSFTPWNVIASALTGTAVTAYLAFASTGAVSFVATPNSTTVAGSPAWWLPVGVAQPGLWIRGTVTSGNAPTTGQAVGTWLNLSGTTILWGFAGATSGSQQCTLTVEIARDAAGANVIFTSAGNQVSATHV
jgi:hypothetical protein